MNCSIRTLLVVGLILPLFSLFPGPAYADVPIPAIKVSDVTSGAAVVGSTFTTDVIISADGTGIQGVELWIPFDENVVQVQDSDGNSANGTQVQIVREFFSGSLAIGANIVFNAAGAPAQCGGLACIHIAVSHTGAPVRNKTGRVAIITWAGIATGPANIGISLDSILSDENGIPIAPFLRIPPNITVEPPGNITGFVGRQGTPSALWDLTDVMAIDVTVIAATQTNAPNGDFSLPVPLGATYTVRASYNGYLQAQRNNVSVGGATVNIGGTTLVGGDINSDNCINILDIVIIIGRWGAVPGRSEPADINDDLVINIQDLSIAAGNFTRCGPTTW